MRLAKASWGRNALVYKLHFITTYMEEGIHECGSLLQCWESVFTTPHYAWNNVIFLLL